MEEYNRSPTNLQTDNGTEFYNKHFRTLMKEYGVNHYSTFSNIKACIVERFNRTLKNAVWKTFSLQGSYEWQSIIQKSIDKYNNTKHRTIGMKPLFVYGKKIENALLENVFSKRKVHNEVHKFRVGDYVRISKHKAEFVKGYRPSWSTEIFCIHETRATVPLTYLLKDCNGQEISGGFYSEELQRVKYHDIYLVERVLKRCGNKVLVKWLGFDASHNCWVNIKDID